jgi:hypothetical protein
MKQPKKKQIVKGNKETPKNDKKNTKVVKKI